MNWYLLRLLFPLACAAWAKQPSAPAPVTAPLRDLSLGDLNFLHTTDTHGWIAGHLSEPSYSGDWGDYISFAQHLRQKVEDEDKDLLLIDTGDRVEGNGLYDASHPKGNFSRDIFAQQDIDVICAGNHELYKKSTVKNELLKVVPRYSTNYIASNVDVTDPKDDKRVPLAQRYKKFETKNRKIRIAAFGFLFNFKEGASNSFVQLVEETVIEDWFQDAIKDREVDLFLVIGHVPAHSDEFSTIYKAIREKQWDTPIMFFGGHRHIRDYAIYDQKAHALASGRYFETVGFQSISGLSSGDKHTEEGTTSAPAFGRRYIDNNLVSYQHHTGLNETAFPTERGKNVSAAIAVARKAMDLDHQLGCAPDDFWMTRVEYPGDASLYSWLEKDVVPAKVVNDERSESPRIVIINTGAMRFDVFKGAFTTGTLYSVSPFSNEFKYIKDVPYDIADRILTVLNTGPSFLKDIDHTLDEHAMTPPEQNAWTQSGLQMPLYEPSGHGQRPLLQRRPDLTPGYTTKDDAGDDGDDTEHSPITHYKVPNCFEARVGTTKPKESADVEPVEKVDLIFIEFIQPWILAALKFLASDYKEKDSMPYLQGRNFTSMIAEWVVENWKGRC